MHTHAHIHAISADSSIIAVAAFFRRGAGALLPAAASRLLLLHLAAVARVFQSALPGPHHPLGIKLTKNASRVALWEPRG